MNTLRAPSLTSLLESDRGSNDSLLAESLQLDLDEVFNELFCLQLLVLTINYLRSLTMPNISFPLLTIYHRWRVCCMIWTRIRILYRTLALHPHQRPHHHWTITKSLGQF